MPSSDYVRFSVPPQWHLLHFDDIYALDGRHPDDPSPITATVPQMRGSAGAAPS